MNCLLNPYAIVYAACRCRRSPRRSLDATELNGVDVGLHYATFADPECNELDLIAR